MGDPIDVPCEASGERAKETGDYVDTEGITRVVAAGDVIPEGWANATAKAKAPAGRKTSKPAGRK